MMSEIGIEKPANISSSKRLNSSKNFEEDTKVLRRSTFDERDREQAIDFQRFCEIMGYETNSFRGNSAAAVSLN